MPSSLALVLGAGASAPYGYPLGAGLRKSILTMHAAKATAYGIINEADGVDQEKFVKFQRAFELSTFYSIDAFLGRRTEFHDVGKRCIAATLLEREVPDVLWNEPAGHWYQYFLNEITVDSWDELDFSRLAIITFNYDRSLETFLLQALKYGYGKTDEEVVGKLASLRIVHVYGSLGPTLPGIAEYFDYDAHVTPTKIVTAAKYLSVIPEGRKQSPTLVQARQWLESADHIAFLGFGFDPINVERLALDGACQMQKVRNSQGVLREVHATCIGLRSAEKDAAYRALTGVSHKQGGDRFADVNCFDLLRNNLLLRK